MVRGIISPPRSRFSPANSPAGNYEPVSQNINNRKKEIRFSTASKKSPVDPSKPSSNPSHKNKFEHSTSTPGPNCQPTRGSPSIKGPIIGCTGSRSDRSGAKPSAAANYDSKYLRNGGLGHHQQVKIGDHHQSIHGKDVKNALHANKLAKSDTNQEQRCSQVNVNNAPRIFQIYKEIASHRQGNSSISSYFTKLKTLWNELTTFIDMPQCSIEKLSEREKVMQFLVGLDDSYSRICAQILFMRPFPTLETAYSIVIREEIRREFVSPSVVVEEKVIEKNWVHRNGDSINKNGDNDFIEQLGNILNELQVYQNEVTSLPDEPLLIDLSSPV